MSTPSIILSLLSLPIAHAAPWQALHKRQSNNNGNPNNSNSSGFSSSVWIPVVFIGGLFLLAAVWLLQRNMAARREDSETEIEDSTTTGQTRELTAADLTGGTRAARRQRRPRRTPSQVSTRSLPAYMKEPGDNEVVIYRGLEDMDEEPEGELQNGHNSTLSADMTLNTERITRDSHDDTRALLPIRTNSPELTRHSLNLSRGSYDHQGSDDSHTRLVDVQRGEAPAYETINLTPTEEPAPVYSRQNPNPTRMSGFFSRFMSHRGNNDTTNEPATLSPLSDSRNSTLPPSHTRGSSLQSGLSGLASADSSRRSHVGRTHRAGSSASSVFPLFSRPVSRNPDDGPITSPSMISLNSISPPLTHTVTRSEFVFPRTGPTSEQVKFLSSKETFSRFSVPYGPDAVSFAASSSRPDLPPDFDSVHQLTIGDLSSSPIGGNGPDLGRSTSTRMISTDSNSDRGDSPPPASAEPSPGLASFTDQPPLSRRKSGPNLEVDTVAPALHDSLPKQKSTPNLGMGHPSMLKSVFKSKSTTNIQSGGDVSLTPRYPSAAGSHLTVESFQTAHEDEDGSVPSLSRGPIPQILVQLPSNNPSLVNLAEGSAKERNSGNSSNGLQNTHTLSSDSDLGSDNESEAETRSNRTDVKVVAALKLSTADLTKTTVEVPRTTTIEA